ncbi:MAG: tetratricopeptide repeat protein [Planctomycetota bacterium]|nr:tetratricopeptide repeat protein [Planctomycetota bacterium]
MRGNAAIWILLAIVAIFVAGGLASTFLYIRAEQDGAVAAAQRARAEEARAMQQAGSRQAEQEAQKVQAITEFLQTMLESVEPRKSGKDLKVSDVLDHASRQVETFRGDLEQQASLWTTIGKTYMSLGLYDQANKPLSKALEIRRKVLGDEHPDTFASEKLLLELRAKEGEADEIQKPSPPKDAGK